MPKTDVFACFIAYHAISSSLEEFSPNMLHSCLFRAANHFSEVTYEAKYILNFICRFLFITLLRFQCLRTTYLCRFCNVLLFADEHSRERPSVSFLGEEQPIEPIYDIPVDQINNLIFGWQPNKLLSQGTSMYKSICTIFSNNPKFLNHGDLSSSLCMVLAH